MNYDYLFVIVIIGLGFIAKKAGLVKIKDGEGLARIVLNFTLPAVVIDAFSTIVIDMSFIYLSLIALLLGVITGTLGLLLLRKEDYQTKGMLLMPLLGVNVGLFAYPLVEAIWGKDIIKYFGVFDMGNSIVIFVLCYIVGAIFSSKTGNIDYRNILKKVSRSIPLIVYILTMLLRLVHWNYPSFVLKVAAVIAQANMPLSLLVLGIFLSFSFNKKTLGKIFRVIGLKYSVGAVCGIILFLTLPYEPYYRYTALVGVLLPTSLSIIPFAVEFDYDAKFIGTVSNISILLSLVLMWVFSVLLK